MNQLGFLEYSRKFLKLLVKNLHEWQDLIFSSSLNVLSSGFCNFEDTLCKFTQTFSAENKKCEMLKN